MDRDLLEVLPQGGFAGMEMTGDPIADAAQLEALLQRLNAIAGGIDLSQINSGGPDEAMLTAMLLNFGVSEDQAANLAKLLRQFMSTEKTDSATGWN